MFGKDVAEEVGGVTESGYNRSKMLPLYRSVG